MEHIPGTVLFGLAFLVFGGIEILTGKIHVERKTIHRKTNPVGFWLSLTITFALGIALVIAGLLGWKP